MADSRGIWLLGDQGMLGRQMALELEKNGMPFIGSDREIDIGDRPSLGAFSAGKKISWIVNCAAYTAVDRAESEREAAFRVNADAIENLAKLAMTIGAKLVHFSTDYVFDGRAARPYTEDDPPCPISSYGQSKREGERRLEALCPRHFLFRVSWLYGVFGHNFVRTMLQKFAAGSEVRVVNDQFGSPTYAAALAANVARLIAGDSDRYGLYHYCDQGVISWYDFATQIMASALERGTLAKAVPLRAIPTADYPTLAVRPPYAALDSGKVVRELGFRVDDWRTNLDAFLSEEAGR